MPTEAVLRLGGGCTTTFPRVRGHMVSQALSRVDDNALIREAQRGNRAAFEELQSAALRYYKTQVPPESLNPEQMAWVLWVALNALAPDEPRLQFDVLAHLDAVIVDNHGLKPVVRLTPI